MLIQRLELENIKCFGQSATVDFTGEHSSAAPHKWVVVYGDNGAGKSTLLRAIALALTGQPALNALLPSAEGWVRTGQRRGSVHAQFTKGPHDISIGFPRQRPIEVTWHLVGNRSTRVGRTLLPAHAIAVAGGASKSERDDVKLLTTQIANDEPARGWLICGYGPHRRLTGAASDISESIPPDGRTARLVTLFHEKAALTSAERWLRELHHRASIYSEQKASLDMVWQVINTGLLPEGVQLDQITPDAVFFRTAYSKKVPISDLSDGYRTVLAVALDLLRHIAYCFDLRKVIDEKLNPARITAEGVVLIDEIDSHLHPSWQRTIGHWLHSRFPNIQFIVATHSPLIPTRVSADEGMIIRLEVHGQKRGTTTIRPHTEEGRMGLSADQNLTGPNFGLRSTRDVLVDSLLAEIDRLTRRVKSRHANSDEKSRLKQLEFQFQQIAPPTATHAGMARWNNVEKGLRELADSIDSAQG